MLALFSMFKNSNPLENQSFRYNREPTFPISNPVSSRLLIENVGCITPVFSICSTIASEKICKSTHALSSSPISNESNVLASFHQNSQGTFAGAKCGSPVITILLSNLSQCLDFIVWRSHLSRPAGDSKQPMTPNTGLISANSIPLRKNYSTTCSMSNCFKLVLKCRATFTSGLSTYLN